MVLAHLPDGDFQDRGIDSGDGQRPRHRRLQDDLGNRSSDPSLMKAKEAVEARGKWPF